MPTLNAYAGFDGNCAEGMRFYERVLSGKLQMMMTVGQSPEAANFPPEMQQRVMHAFLVGDGLSLMAGDAMGQPLQRRPRHRPGTGLR